MDSKQRHSFQDFVEYAEEYCPDEYAALMDPEMWMMKPKTIREQDKSLRRERMLLVGTPFYRNGRQNLWAIATGLGVDYYYGQPDEEFVHPLHALQVQKTYFDPPLRYVSGSQAAKGMTKSRRVGKALAELVINVVFLLKGELYFVWDLGGTDMLGDFKYACLNFEANRQSEEEEERVVAEQIEANKVAQGQARRERWQTEQSRFGVKEESHSDDDEASFRSAQSISVAPSPVRPHRKYLLLSSPCIH